MMRKILITLILLVVSVILFAQERETPTVLLKNGMASLKEKDYYDAIDQFSLLIQQDSISEYGYLYRGYARLGVNATKDAIDDFSRVIQINPKNYKAYFDRAKARITFDDITGAIVDLETVVNENQNSETAYTAYAYLSKLYFQAKNYKSAMYAYTQIINKNPTDFQSLFQRAICHERLKDYSGAILDYSSVLRISPEYSEAYGNRGVAKINQLLSEDFPKDKKIRQKEACGDLRRAKKFDDPVISTMISKYCTE